MREPSRFFAAVIGITLSCGGNVPLDHDVVAAAPPTEPSPDAGPLPCEPERGLLRVTDVLAHTDDSCHTWIAQTFGRAARVSVGSGSIWSRRTRYGTGLLLTASHVYSRCTLTDAPREPNGDCPETLVAPENGQNAARLTESSGVYASRWTPLFALYSSFIPASVLGRPSILPRHEISLWVADATTYEPWDTSATPLPTHALLPLHDPADLTRTTPTWSEPVAGARVVALGYPSEHRQVDLTAGIGHVLADEEVPGAQRYLREQGDEEGDVTYEPEVEFFYRGRGIRGMSGGGVFDERGRQVGVIVRGSQLDGELNYVRAVRMSYVVARIEAARSLLSDEQRAAIDPYLEAP